MNRAVSEGILRGFRQGLLTSTSLLANAPDAGSGACSSGKSWRTSVPAGRLPSAAARRRLGDPDCPFDLGVHLNLTQGRPLTGSRYPAELLDPHGRFPGVFALFARLRRSGDRFRAADSSGTGAAGAVRLRPRPAADAPQRASIRRDDSGRAAIVPELMERFGIRRRARGVGAFAVAHHRARRLSHWEVAAGLREASLCRSGSAR